MPFYALDVGVGDGDAVSSAETAEVTYGHRVAGQIARDAPGDDRYGTGSLTAAARHVAVAWAAALTVPGSGDRADALPAAVARPEAVRILLHPGRESWSTGSPSRPPTGRATSSSPARRARPST